MASVSFALNSAQMRRQLTGVLIGCLGAVAAVVLVAYVARGALDGPRHSTILVMVLGTLLFFALIVSIVVATRLFDLRSSPDRVTVDDLGLWMGETYYSFTDLREVWVTDVGRPRAARRLVLSPLDGPRQTFRLGRGSGGSDSAEGDYRQFVQVLRTAVAGHDNLPPLGLLD